MAEKITIPDDNSGTFGGADPDGNTLPPAPGRQYDNSPVVPPRIVPGEVSSLTPDNAIEETSKIFRLRSRHRQTEDDPWRIGAIATSSEGGISNRWNFGNPLASHYRIARDNKEWELVCIFRSWNAEEGDFEPYGPVHICGIVDPEAYLPTGGKEGEVCIIIDGKPRWKQLEISDIAGLTAFDTGLYDIESTLVTRNSMRIEIVKSPGTGQYQLRYRVFSNADPDGKNEIGWTPRTAQASAVFDLANLKTATTYQIQAKRGTNDWSRAFTRTTQQAVTTTPDKPILTGVLRLRQGTLSPTGFILDWDNPVQSFQRFRVLQDGVLIGTTSSNFYSFLGLLSARYDVIQSL